MTKIPVIAVVDDDVSICKAFKRLFAASGLDTTTFLSGQAFLKSLADGPPDCVVLDFHMPELTGLDVLHALRRTGSRLPVIVITGRHDLASEAKCKAAGALAYLPKPIGNKVLLEAIGEAVRRR
jgi:FixJ family two-component response regulator